MQIEYNTQIEYNNNSISYGYLSLMNFSKKFEEFENVGDY